MEIKAVHVARTRRWMPAIPRAPIGGLAMALAVYLALLARPAMTELDVPFVWMTPALCALTLAHALVVLGWRRALAFFAVGFTVSLSAELAGTLFGGVFGAYHYTDVLPHKILGEVPALIPLAWFLMLYPSHVVANLVSGEPSHGPWRGWARAIGLSLLAALFMTGWDAAIDPHLVHRTRAWVWADPGVYFGIPLSNYIGWIGTTFVVFLSYRVVERFVRRRPLARLPEWFDALPLSVFGLMILGHLLYGYPEQTLLLPLCVLGTPLVLALARLQTFGPRR